MFFNHRILKLKDVKLIIFCSHNLIRSTFHNCFFHFVQCTHIKGENESDINFFLKKLKLRLEDFKLC